MQSLFKKLQDPGFNRAFVKKMLPDRWDDSIAATPAGLQQTTFMLGQLLCIRPDSLSTPGSNAVFVLPESRIFKRRNDLDDETLDVACALAFSAARIALHHLEPAGWIVDQQIDGDAAVVDDE
ncbi:MAG: hypothetical protein RL748_4453 [Pseudomonadota bacterium]|jgi:hypothetical protein